MQAAGVRVAPYINGRIYDMGTESWYCAAHLLAVLQSYYALRALQNAPFAVFCSASFSFEKFSGNSTTPSPQLPRTRSHQRPFKTCQFTKKSAPLPQRLCSSLNFLPFAACAYTAVVGTAVLQRLPSCARQRSIGSARLQTLSAN
jgi:hypothetical protein